jgi:predicted alpha/beta hydrolase family esterase
MKHHTHLKTEQALLAAASRYDFVLVPGRYNSSELHWQSIWERELPIWKRISQRNWDDGDIGRWTGSLRRLLAQSVRPAVLVGHSLGALASCCIAVESPLAVAGLMLVAPAEPAKFHAEDDVPARSLPVASVLVASHNDPFMSFPRAEHWASIWGSRLVDMGDAGHVNVESGFGAWAFGKDVLRELVERVGA